MYISTFARGNGSLFTRMVAVVLSCAFFVTNIAFAAPVEPERAASAAPAAEKTVVTDPEKIVISRDIGIVKSKHAGRNDKLIVHIQDAHCNFEAQSNIAKMIECLVKNDGQTLVSVEGADGLVDTSWFKAFPDAEIRKEVATYFMKKGEITGPEFVSITTDLPIKLYGAETREYYIQNLNAFTASYPLKAETEKYYTQVKSVLNRLKGFIYNDGLKELDRMTADYEEKKVQFNDYIRFLQERAEKLKINTRAYDNFFKLISVLVYEKKIDFNVVDKERSAVIDDLTKKMSKDQVANLVAQSLAFKVGKISSAEFYAYLKALAQQYRVDLAENYPNLFNYIIYNAVYSRIENEKLFADIKTVETAIKEKLFQNDDQRRLEKLSRHVDTVLGLINIKLLNADYEYYETHKEEFSPAAFAGFIKEKAIQYGLSYSLDDPSEAVTQSVPKLEEFYAIAIKRDNALVENTLASMEKEGAAIAVLVTGGFHSEGITRLLENAGFSYLVVCPNITKNEPSPYIQILTNQRTSFEDLLTDTGAAAPAAQARTLAPFSLAEAVNLTEEELAGVGQAVDGATIEDRVRNAEAAWTTLHVELWLAKAFQYAASHQFARNPDIFRQAYRIAAAKDIARLGLDAELGERILGSGTFEAAFTMAYRRLAPTDARDAIAQPRTDRPRGPSPAMAGGTQEMVDLIIAAFDKVVSAMQKLFAPKKVETGRDLKERYVKDLDAKVASGAMRPIAPADLAYEMTPAQFDRYSAAIGQVMQERGAAVATPEILFIAAARATEGDRTAVEAKVALQPGTMNPLTYGHITASLGALLDQDANHAILMNGGTVPDKPYASSAETRNAMAKEAIKDPGLGKWLTVSSIRDQGVKLFADPKLAGKTADDQRKMMDMAAFIWLMAANPNVTWFYAVGSDKLENYNKERLLIEETLAGKAATTEAAKREGVVPPKMRVLYFDRADGKGFDPAKHIDPYEWLRGIWNAGTLFVKSGIKSFEDVSATVVRTRFVNGELDGLETMLPQTAIEYIQKNDALKAIYEAEIKEKQMLSLIAAGKQAEALRIGVDLQKKLRAVGVPQDEKGLFAFVTQTLDRRVAALENYARLMDGSLVPTAIESMPVADKADLLRVINLDELPLQQKMLLYSAPPGTGKGTIMDATLKGPYKDLVGKFTLFHTRNARNGEVDGVAYHFGNLFVGTAKNRVTSLITIGKLIGAHVNKQLQGYAQQTFVDTVTIRPRSFFAANRLPLSEMLLPGDRIVARNGAALAEPETYTGREPAAVDEETVVERRIQGLEDAFDSKKVTVLEGGYSWFSAISGQNPDIYTIFLSAYTQDQLNNRYENQRIIEQSFVTPLEHLVAYCTLNQFRKSAGTENIDLRDTATLQELKSAVVRWMGGLDRWLVLKTGDEDLDSLKTNLGKWMADYRDWVASGSKDPARLADLRGKLSRWIKYYENWQKTRVKDNWEKSVETALAVDGAQGDLMEALGRNRADQVAALMWNALLIESDSFVDEVDYSLQKFFGFKDSKARAALTKDPVAIRTLAYEVQLRLAKDVGRGDTAFKIEPPAQGAYTDLASFTKTEDMFNRVIEGLVQYLLMNNYNTGVRAGKGALVVNAFEYDPAKLGDALQRVSGQFVGQYFTYLLTAISQNRRQDRASPGETAKDTVELYLNTLASKEMGGRVASVDPETIKYQMTGEEQTEYLSAIQQVLRERKADKISPAVLYEAAGRALKGKQTSTVAIGTLQPGTMNPLHYGHISASLATLLHGEGADPDTARRGAIAFLANGGTVPDKPYASSADVRNEMARIAVASDRELRKWLRVTPIRDQVVGMFGVDPETGRIPDIAGKDDSEKRALMDMAAFIWLFVANPNVKWVYAVGSDKIAGYHKEQVLLDGTLSGHAKVLYFERTGAEVSYAKSVAPYAWLKKLWKGGLFMRSAYPSFPDLAAVNIRSALSKPATPGERTGDRAVGQSGSLDEVIPQEVIDYITADTPEGKMLRFLYPLENAQAATDKLAAAKKYDEALQRYAEIREKVEAEKAKPEAERQAPAAILDAVLKNVDKAASNTRAAKLAARIESGKVTKAEFAEAAKDETLVSALGKVDAQKIAAAAKDDPSIRNISIMLEMYPTAAVRLRALKVLAEMELENPDVDLADPDTVSALKARVDAPKQPGDAITMTGEELTPDQHARVNAIIARSFDTTEESEQALLVAYKEEKGVMVEVYVIPGLESEDSYLVAHAGRGGEALDHTFRRVYVSPTRYEWVNGLSEAAREQFWAHEMAHSRLRNENADITEADVQRLYPIDLVLREAGAAMPVSVAEPVGPLAASEDVASVAREHFAGLPESLRFPMAADYTSLQSLVHSLSLVREPGKKLILAVDTALDPANRDALTSAARALETQVNRYLGGALIEIRGTGAALADRVAAEAGSLSGKANFVVVTIAADRTLAAVKPEILPSLGKVINLEMKEINGTITPVPLMALYEFALLLAFADQDTIRLERCLSRIMDERDNMVTVKEVIDLLVNNEHKIVRILPRLAPINFNEAREAFKAAQAAAMSL